MTRDSLRPAYVMGSIIAALLALTAGAGVVDKSIYRPFLEETLVEFQYFQDMLSLLLSPCLVITMLLTRKHSRRALVLWTGIMVYVAYYYAFYGFGFVYTVYYPLYLALMGLSVYSLIVLLTSADIEDVRAAAGERMPVKLIAAVLGMTALFVPIWLSMLVEGIRTQQVHRTDLVFVLDLPYLIPACLFAAVQIWRRQASGFLVAGPLLFKATVSGILLTGGELLKLQRGLPLALDQFAMYLFLSVVGVAALISYLANLKDGEVTGFSVTTPRPSQVRTGS